MIARTALLAFASAVVLLAPVALASAQSALDGPPPSSGPQPLWVPDPEDAAVPADEAEVDVEVRAPVSVDYPAADDPARVAVAHWMAAGARAADLPGELPVMAALVESGVRNLPYGHADSVGFFQMRLGVWNKGVYEGYLARPELQLRWFVEHAVAVRDARRAAGDATYGEDPATWGEWIANVERPFAAYRGRYQLRLDEARALLAMPAPAVAPFELGLAVGGAAAPEVDPAGAALAQRVLEDPAVTLDTRAVSDLVAGRVDPRLSAALLQAAARTPIAIWVFQTGHSYYTVHGTVSNHSSGRAADIGSVGGAVVSPRNEAARKLALAIGQLPPSIRPTEIGTPWKIDEPGFFTDGDHQDHLHIGFDDSAAFDTVAAEPVTLTEVRVARKRASAPAEPRFDAEGAKPGKTVDRAEPRFEVGR